MQCPQGLHLAAEEEWRVLALERLQAGERWATRVEAGCRPRGVLILCAPEPLCQRREVSLCRIQRQGAGLHRGEEGRQLLRGGVRQQQREDGQVVLHVPPQRHLQLDLDPAADAAAADEDDVGGGVGEGLLDLLDPVAAPVDVLVPPDLDAFSAEALHDGGGGLAVGAGEAEEDMAHGSVPNSRWNLSSGGMTQPIGSWRACKAWGVRSVISVSSRSRRVAVEPLRLFHPTRLGQGARCAARPAPRAAQPGLPVRAFARLRLSTGQTVLAHPPGTPAKGKRTKGSG